MQLHYTASSIRRKTTRGVTLSQTSARKTPYIVANIDKKAFAQTPRDLRTDNPSGSTMNINMGSIDRTIRLLLAITVGVLYFTGQLSGLAAIILGVMAVAFILTSTIGFCPLYAPFGWSTKSSSTAGA